ncbi:helix-turn-helix domain-containing protein [Pseudalkalibacillus sp. Hm43]|uniref:helix-turn-helix domain-containing protein n=1 Tax=Pseudalkalibacillus sp. Hm43 TaxID=3450742 RepID=UPI003F4344A2
MSLYDEVQKAKRNDREAMERILERLEPKIKHTVLSIEKKYQEDVEQEVKLRVMEAVRRYEVDDLPSFVEMLQKSEAGHALLEKLKDDNSEAL